MSHKRTSTARRPIKKGGKFFPAFCNILGTLILVVVILVSVPLAVPRFLGYDAYNVITGSMEPTIPVGSVVYVERVEPDSVLPDEIIAFYREDEVVTHRAVENHYLYDEIVTKGDANASNDINPVKYSEFIGKVRWHFPLVGNYLSVYSSQVTKIYLLCLAACGVLFNILANRIRVHQDEKFREQLERYDRRQAAKINAEIEKIKK